MKSGFVSKNFESFVTKQSPDVKRLNLQSSPNQAWVVNCFKLFWEGFHITAFESIPQTQNIFYSKKSL